MAMNEKEISEYCDQEVFQSVMAIYSLINEKIIDSGIKKNIEELLIKGMDIGAYYFESKFIFNEFYAEVCRKLHALCEDLKSNLRTDKAYEFLLLELKVFEGQLDYIASNKN